MRIKIARPVLQVRALVIAACLIFDSAGPALCQAIKAAEAPAGIPVSPLINAQAASPPLNLSPGFGAEAISLSAQEARPAASAALALARIGQALRSDQNSGIAQTAATLHKAYAGARPGAASDVAGRFNTAASPSRLAPAQPRAPRQTDARKADARKPKATKSFVSQKAVSFLLLGLAPLLMAAKGSASGLSALPWLIGMGAMAVAQVPGIADFAKIRQAIIDFVDAQKLRQNSGMIEESLEKTKNSFSEGRFEPLTQASLSVEAAAYYLDFLETAPELANMSARASGLAAEGDFSGAKAVAEEAGLYGKIQIYRQIAPIEFNAGVDPLPTFDEMEKTAETLAEDLRDLALADLIETQATTNERFIKKSKDDIRKIKHLHHRDTAIRKIAKAEIALGRFAEAGETADWINNSSYYRSTLEDLSEAMRAHAQTLVSNSQEPLSALTPENKEQISAAAAKAGDGRLIQALGALRAWLVQGSKIGVIAAAVGLAALLPHQAWAATVGAAAERGAFGLMMPLLATLGVAVITQVPEIPDFAKIRRAIIDFAGAQVQLKRSRTLKADLSPETQEEARARQRFNESYTNYLSYPPRRPDHDSAQAISQSYVDSIRLEQARELAAAGSLDDARKPIQEVENINDKMRGYAYIAEAGIKATSDPASTFELAMEIARAQERADIRDHAIAELAAHIGFLKHRFLPQALEMIREIKDQAIKNRALHYIAFGQTLEGNFAAAEETAEKMTPGWQRRAAVSDIAGNMKRHAERLIFDSEEARSKLHPELTERIFHAAAAAGDKRLVQSLGAVVPPERHEKLVEKINEAERPMIRQLLAAGAGKITIAAALAAFVFLHPHHAFAATLGATAEHGIWSSAAALLAALGAAAITQIPEIPDFARLRRAINDFAGAQAQFRRSRTLTADLSPAAENEARERHDFHESYTDYLSYSPLRAHHDIALAQSQPYVDRRRLEEARELANAGKFDDAKDRVLEIENIHDKMRGYGYIAEAEATANGDPAPTFELAMKIARAQERADIRDHALGEMAALAALLKHRFLPWALKFASAIKDQAVKNRALHDIAFGQTLEGNFAAAEETAAEIPPGWQRRQTLYDIAFAMQSHAKLLVSDSKKTIAQVSPALAERIFDAAVAAGDKRLVQSLGAVIPPERHEALAEKINEGEGPMIRRLLAAGAGTIAEKGP